MNTQTDPSTLMRLFTHEDICGFLCEACAMKIPVVMKEGGWAHSFMGQLIPCAAYLWRTKPQVLARLEEKRTPQPMNLQTKVEGALASIPHGWCSVEKAQTLAAAVLSLRPSIVVEIGVYAGRSFIPMALALQALAGGTNKPGKAIGIDPYDAQISAQGEKDDNKGWWLSFDHEIILDWFTTCMNALELQPYVELIRKKSDDVTPPDNIGLLHVDGSHTDQAIRDVRRFAPNVMIGGMVCLDDILWDGGAVSQAAEVLKTMGFDELYRVIGQEAGAPWFNNWAMFQRIDFSQK